MSAEVPRVTQQDNLQNQPEPQYRFKQHKVIAEYERDFTFTVDTAELTRPGFADVIEGASTDLMEFYSKSVDDGRYTLKITHNSFPGFLGVRLVAQHGSGPLSGFPRAVIKVVFQVSCYDRLHKIARSFVNKTRLLGAPDKNGVLTPKYVGLSKFVDLARLKTHLQAATTTKRLIFNVRVVEMVNTEQMTTLKAPSISLSKIAQGFGHALDQRPTVRVIFPDGEYLVQEDFLTAKCKHFRDALTGGFKESITKSKKRKLAALQSDEGEILASQEETELAAEASRQRSASAASSDLTSISSGNGGHEASYNLADDDSDYVEPNEGDSDGENLSDKPHMKELKVTNFSVNTFRSFIGYLYTGCVTFNPFLNSDHEKIPDELRVDSLLPAEWACSPKSLYRMADYYDVPELKTKCGDAFAALLTPHNVLHEMVQPFAKLHESILIVISDYVKEHWSQISANPDFASRVETVMTDAESRDAFIQILKGLGEVARAQ